VSNLVIIPCLGIILGLGLLIICLALLNILTAFLASIYGWVIEGMNLFVGWVSNQEAFLFKNIPFSIGQVLLSYLLIISLIILIKWKTHKSLASVLMVVLIFQSYLIYSDYNASSKAFVVFHKSMHSAIGITQNKQIAVHHNIENISKENFILNFNIGEGINMTTSDSIKHIYTFNNKKMLIIDSLGIYNVKSFRPDIILLRNSPKVNLKRIIDSLQPELIISDGSNYKTYQDRWNATCEAKKIPFHQTSKKGAYIYRY
jgi:competence protein ComEC